MLNLFLSITRLLSALIDTLVVWLIENLYFLLVQIANTNVFGDFVYQILGRVYVFLGLFMIFKLSMSMITYIINPDAMTDKSKGFGKLITNVVISLILIVTVPTIFKEAFRLQYKILNSNAIYQIVTGRELPSKGIGQLEENAKSMGKTIATEVYKLFIYKAEGPIWNLPDEVKMPVKPNAEGDNVECTDIDCMLDLDTINNTKDGLKGNFGFTNVYWFILSTLAGAVVCYFFLVFCFDAATRTIKLGALQIVSPIPILSMMDPKVGNEKLKKWASECGKEFAGLFIRLAGVFFAVAIIQLVTENANGVDNAFTQYGPDGGATNDPVSIFVKLFVIIGALMFAKKLPQWIESVLGFKLSGDGSGFNLKKKLAGAAGLGAVAGVAGLGAKKAIAGWDSWRHGKGFWNGTKNVQGNGFVSKMQKGWRDMNPNATEYHQNRKKAQESMSQRDKTAKIGEKLFNEHNGDENSLLKTLNQDYAKSYKIADDLKKDMFAAESALDAARQTGDFKKISDASIAYGKAKKKYELANANYEDMKVIHSKDAAAHDAFSTYSKMNGSPVTTSSNAEKATQAAQPTSKPASDGRAAAYQQTHSSDTSTWE